ncbi:MAG TPA: hypothetical protein VIL01_06720 [Thermomicrobiales bacterium]
MQRHGRLGLVIALGLIFALVAAGSGSPLAAQEDATPVPEAETGGTPAASPVATVPSDAAPVFAADRWRITVVAAKRGAAIPEVRLTENEDRDWIVVIADVTNWSEQDATLRPRDFGIRLVGSEDARGFASRTTERTAERLDLEPRNVDDGVRIRRGRTTRIALVFQIERDGAAPALALDGAALPLDGALAANVDLESLPPVTEPPELETARVRRVRDGMTLDITGSVNRVRLTALDPPLPEECYGGQSTARLERLAGSEVLLEPVSDGFAYVWAVQGGRRILLNQRLVADGYAALQPNPSGPYAAWLADSQQQAQFRLAGLWGACTGPHGVARTTKPERSILTIRTNGADREYTVYTPYEPVLVSTPDGGAWAFFTASAEDGPTGGNNRVYAARFDPAVGEWSPAEPLPGGEITFGPSAVVDSRGYVHVVYSVRDEADQTSFSTLVYVREDDDGGWTEPMPVSPYPEAGHQIQGALAIGADDTLYVAWQDQRLFSPEARTASAANADILLSEKKPNDDEWSIPYLVNPHLPTAAALSPRIVVDGDRIVVVWSVYTAELGIEFGAAHIDWATRPVDDPDAWSTPEPLVFGRGDRFGGRYVDLAADPHGGVVLVFARQANDTFLFLRRLPPGSNEWGGDVLLTFGEKGTYPSVTVSKDGNVYASYNVGVGAVVDVGAVAIPFRSIAPGAEVVLTQDDPDTQGLAVITTDVTGKPWLIYASEVPGELPDKIHVLRNAEIPTES